MMSSSYLGLKSVTLMLKNVDFSGENEYSNHGVGLWRQQLQTEFIVAELGPDGI